MGSEKISSGLDAALGGANELKNGAGEALAGAGQISGGLGQARPLDEVFAFVADARNRPLWDDSVESEELTSPEPIGVGSTVRTRLRSMGREYVLTWEIVEHEPPVRQTIESTSGPFPTKLAYQLSAHDGGGTVVAFSVTGRPRGMLRLFEPVLARSTQKNLDRGFPRLKRFLETGTAS